MGSFLFIFILPVPPSVDLAWKYEAIIFVASFISVPSGIILVMISKLIYRVEYILAVLIFMVTITFIFSPSLSGFDKPNRKPKKCCPIFRDKGGCKMNKLPEPFRVDWDNDGVKENCTSRLPGKNLQDWKILCNCPSY